MAAWAATPPGGTSPEKSVTAASPSSATRAPSERTSELSHPGSAPPTSPDDDAFGDGDRFRGRVDAGLAFGIGLLPAPGIGLDLGLGFQWHRLSLTVEGRALLTPNFALTPDHAAYGAMGLGILRLCYQQVGSVPRPLYSLDFCPILGAGRLFIAPIPNENQPNYIVAEAHPFAVITGVRLPVSWQVMPTRAPFFYLRAYVEGELQILRNHVSFNGVPIWDNLPPFGLTLGLEFSAVVNQPRSWDRADRDSTP